MFYSIFFRVAVGAGANPSSHSAMAGYTDTLLVLETVHLHIQTLGKYKAGVTNSDGGGYSCHCHSPEGPLFNTKNTDILETLVFV